MKTQVLGSYYHAQSDVQNNKSNFQSHVHGALAAQHALHICAYNLIVCHHHVYNIFSINPCYNHWHLGQFILSLTLFQQEGCLLEAISLGVIMCSFYITRHPCWANSDMAGLLSFLFRFFWFNFVLGFFHIVICGVYIVL